MMETREKTYYALHHSLVSVPELFANYTGNAPAPFDASLHMEGDVTLGVFLEFSIANFRIQRRQKCLNLRGRELRAGIVELTRAVSNLSGHDGLILLSRREKNQAVDRTRRPLIGDPRFAPVFALHSRAEVSIVGRLDRPGRSPALVSGQIDRLVVTADEVLIVDYKTNHAPPGAAAQAPAAYVRQLALYRAVLRKLYPQLPVRAALIWTETPQFMEISSPALDAELAAHIQRDDRA